MHLIIIHTSSYSKHSDHGSRFLSSLKDNLYKYHTLTECTLLLKLKSHFSHELYNMYGLATFTEEQKNPNY